MDAGVLKTRPFCKVDNLSMRKGIVRSFVGMRSGLNWAMTLAVVNAIGLSHLLPHNKPLRCERKSAAVKELCFVNESRVGSWQGRRPLELMGAFSKTGGKSCWQLGRGRGYILESFPSWGVGCSLAESRYGINAAVPGVMLQSATTQPQLIAVSPGGVGCCG